MDALKKAVKSLAMDATLAHDDNDPDSRAARMKGIVQKGKAAADLALAAGRSDVAEALGDVVNPSGGAGWEGIAVGIKDAVQKLGIEGELHPDAKKYFDTIEVYTDGGRRRGRGKKSRKARKTRKTRKTRKGSTRRR
jgi:hypothetical protein